MKQRFHVSGSKGALQTLGPVHTEVRGRELLSWGTLRCLPTLWLSLNMLVLCHTPSYRTMFEICGPPVLCKRRLDLLRLCARMQAVIGGSGVTVAGEERFSFSTVLGEVDTCLT